MTTIAYRDGVLACESLVTAGTMRAGSLQDKIARSPQGYIAGAAGRMGHNVAFNRWIEAGMPEEAKPELGDDFDAIIVSPDGVVSYVSDKLVICPIDAPFAAIGSGEKYAMAAMEMGASAERAIEVAMKFDTSSGGEIKTLKLGEPR